MEFLLLLLPIIFIVASALVVKKAVSRGAKRKNQLCFSYFHLLLYLFVVQHSL